MDLFLFIGREKGLHLKPLSCCPWARCPECHDKRARLHERVSSARMMGRLLVATRRPGKRASSSAILCGKYRPAGETHNGNHTAETIEHPKATRAIALN